MFGCMQRGSTACLAICHRYDEEWAKDQFASGLAPRVAELLLLKAPRSLQDYMVEAERVEMTLRYAQHTRANRGPEPSCIVIV